MENEKKTNPLKTVLLVFGILFSIVLVPGLILGIPGGGFIIGISSTVSQERIEGIVEDTELSGTLYDMLMEELIKEVPAEEVPAEEAPAAE